MNDLEFYIYDDQLWVISDDGNKRITEKDTEIVKYLIDKIAECYPDAYKALEEKYKKQSTNVPYYQFLIANRFCRCNFGELDSRVKDVNKVGSFNFEKVKCPMRGECKYEGVVCMPRFNTAMSGKELQVMRLVYDGLSNEEVADRLFISPFTVKNHIKSVYLKLGIHEKAEFIKYANHNNLFEP